MHEQSKPFWLSKTILFNGLTLLSVIFAAIADEQLLNSYALRWLMVAQAAVNVGLRLVTHERIKVRGNDDED